MFSTYYLSSRSFLHLSSLSSHFTIPLYRPPPSAVYLSQFLRPRSSTFSSTDQAWTYLISFHGVRDIGGKPQFVGRSIGLWLCFQSGLKRCVDLADMAAEIPAEQTGESAAAGETQRAALLTPFLTKTYQLVDDPAVDDLISWNEDGSGFIIWMPAEFARDLLPKYFKHNNLSSFVRQLNTYGFRKVVPDRFEFANDFFKKGEKGLLHDIQRRKMTIGVTSSAAEGPSVVQSMQSSLPKSGDDEQSTTPGGSAQLQVTDSTTTTPPVVVVEDNELGVMMSQQEETKSSSPELVEENERLEQENQQMTNELSHLKGLCNNIFSMMSNYGPSGQQDLGNMSVESKQLQSGMVIEEQGGSSGGGDKEVEEKTSPRLFGVSIGGAKHQKINEEDRSSRRRKHRDDPQTKNNNYSNKAQSERKQEPGPS